MPGYPVSNRNEELSIREVVSVERVVKTEGGAMRPRDVPHHSCLLTCGHTMLKRKSKSSHVPPTRMKCLECRQAKLEALDAQP